MSTHFGPSPAINTSAVRNTVGRGKEKSQENLNEPVYDAALREFRDKNYNQLLPILAKKMHQEKVQQEKLKAIKARLNFEETSQYSESGAPSRRRGIRKRLRPKDARRMSRSPEPRRYRSRSPRRKDTERETVFTRLEKGVFHRLGDKEKGTEPAPKRHHDRKAYSRKGGRMSESEDSAGGHWKSKSKKQRSSVEDDDLSQPWVCEETDPFTHRIRYFDIPKRIRMPSHVKMYDGSEDPKDHLKIFQAAAKAKWWAMPTWCHMFNSTLTRNARVWFDDLPPESIDSYDDIKEAFLANYLQQKKCIKDPVEIYHIKQREGESTEDFVRRFKIESRDVKGAMEVMRISGFMHGITNPEPIKRLHDKIPKSVDEMWKITTAFLRGEVAAGNQERKKTFQPWKQQDVGHRQNFKKGGFKNQQSSEKRQDIFALLSKTPKEILALEKGKFKAPPPMTTPVEKRNSNKFCEFHGEVGHNTDECMHLKRQIKELLKNGKLSHVIKEIKQSNRKDLQKTNKKGEASGKDKALAILMVQPWQRVARQRITQSFSPNLEILFPPIDEEEGAEGPMIIEAEVGSHFIHRMYVDGGSASKIMYEHCFNKLLPEVKSRMVPATAPLIGFSGEIIWPLGQISLLIQAVPSTAHGMLKFPVEGGVLTIRSSKIVTIECASIAGPIEQPHPINQAVEERVKVAINPEYPNQTVMIRSTLTKEGQNKLCHLLRRNLDIFAWKPADMTGVPRHITEHRLNVQEGCPPIRQKRRGQTADRNKVIQEEVGKLVDVRIMKEVYYHGWLSNPVMNVESLCGFPFKCFLDSYKGYHQIKMVKEDEEKTAFITSQGKYCYSKMPCGLRNAGATYQRLVDKAFHKQVGRNLEVYVDDLDIKSRTEEEIIRDIEETFKKLKEIIMKLNPKKCTFGVEDGMFLGYKVNTKGIKVCPDKVDAVLSLPYPKCLKDIQKLNEKLVSLNRFLAKSAEKSLPFFKTLKKCTKKSDFCWTDEAKSAFKQMKQHIAELPMLTALEEKEELIVYLAAARETVSTVLMTKREAKQMPIYFVSRALRGPEVNYTSMEKPVLALVHASKRLKRYFQAHPIIVITDQPIKQVLSKPEVEDGSGAGLILTSPEGMEFTYALRFGFEATNNEVEYEALNAGLRIAEQIGIKSLQANVDSQLVANQVNETYITKEADMIRYLEKIASTSFAHLSKQVLVEELKEKSIIEAEILVIVEEEGEIWMTPIHDYITGCILPAEADRARAVKRKSQRYSVVNGILYKKSFLGPWLRCVRPLQANYVLREIHEGSCSMHAGTRSVVSKAFQIGYYWPTKDARALIWACKNCQENRPILRNPQQKLNPITSPWPFYKWGLDIVGPFPEGPGKVKFLIVAIDYFTKWIEAKPVATITGNQVKKFVWDNIVCRFGLPGEIILDNGKQFRDNPFKYCLGERIKARLEARSKNWMEEISHVIWAQRTMIKSSNGDTPFSLTYGTEAVIPVEIGMPTLRTAEVDVVRNDEALEVNLDLL
ncbi:reverse transcriptase domain-containing protein [Tanacetum coccineum]